MIDPMELEKLEGLYLDARYGAFSRKSGYKKYSHLRNCAALSGLDSAQIAKAVEEHRNGRLLNYLKDLIQCSITKGAIERG